MTAYTYPQMIKYSCHIVLVGQLRKDGWRDDHRRFRKVLKEDELCPRCEKRLEKEMCRSLHWLKPRKDFQVEVVYITRNGDEPMTSPEWPTVTDSEPKSADGSQAEDESVQDTDPSSDAGGSADETEEHAREPEHSSGSEASPQNSGQDNDTKGDCDKDENPHV